MPKHQVSLVISHPLDIQSKDIEVDVREDDKLLGTVRISRGTIDWVPRRGQPYYMSWGQFTDAMRDSGNKRRPHTSTASKVQRRTTSRSR